jgi:O-succinylbenzoic acid--CoA ligase
LKERIRKSNGKISKISFEKSFHKPKEIIFIERIPRTPNGKVNRIELKICFKVYL